MTRPYSASRHTTLSVIVLIFARNGLCAESKVRVFDSPFELVWSAAVDVASERFIPEKISKGERLLRFRTGPFNGYRFDVVIAQRGEERTRVEIGLRTNYYAIHATRRDAWGHGNVYLKMLRQRLDKRRPN